MLAPCSDGTPRVVGWRRPCCGHDDGVNPPVTDLAATARVLMRAGLLAPVRPDRLPGMVLAVVRYGLTPAAAYGSAAARHPDRVAIVDDDGQASYRELDERSNGAA